jgi:hypothetical protein
VVYLQCWQFIPEDRLAELLREVFGVDVATATIAAMGHKKAAELAGLAATIGAQVNQAPVKHLEETGLRIGGLTQWLHVASPWLLTCYRTSRKRGELWGDMVGIIIHDHWHPYFTMPGVPARLVQRPSSAGTACPERERKGAVGAGYVPVSAPGLSCRESCPPTREHVAPALSRVVVCPL